MKNNKKKGFTIVELVIVIAVIAILAAVLIPTFSNVISKANASKALQVAKNALTNQLVENDGFIENNTYLFVMDGDESVYWYKYVDGILNTLDSKPEDVYTDINYAYAYRDSDASSVEIRRPIVKDLVEKLNELLLDENAITYERIADAGKDLTDFEMNIINFRETGYKFAYSLTTNKVFIANDNLTEVKYSNTGISTIPADMRILTGANINTAQDLENFSKITNLHDGGIPTEKNIFVNSNVNQLKLDSILNSVNNSSSPLVILNLNSDIDMSSVTDYKEIALWYVYGNENGKNYNDICLLLNGNKHKIKSVSSSLIGSLRTGSVIKDLEVEYKIGSSSTKAKFSDTNAGSNIKYGSEDKIWHAGLFVNYIVSHADDSTSDIIIFDNIKLSGEVYMIQQGRFNSMGLFLGYYANDKANANSKISFNNIQVFTDVKDKVVIDYKEDNPTGKNDAFGCLVGVISYERNVELKNVYSIDLPCYANHYGVKPNTYSDTLFGNVETY